jgi:hypothetical protein
MSSRIVYNCRPIPKDFGSTKGDSEGVTPSDFQLLFEIANAPRAPVADTLRKSLLECFDLMAITIINKKIDTKSF